MLASKYAGRYSVGNSITLADVVLAPAIDGALRFGVDIGEFQTITRVMEELNKVEAFEKGSWKTQPDTPEEFRTS